jgi:hypothetical protein
MISDIDHDRVKQHRWFAHEANRTGTPYAATTMKINDRRTTVYLHRFITQCPPQYKVDYQNRDTLDNQRGNLRISSHQQNNANRETWSLNGYKGVSFDRGRYRSRIKHVDLATAVATKFNATSHKAKLKTTLRYEGD